MASNYEIYGSKHVPTSKPPIIFPRSDTVVRVRCIDTTTIMMCDSSAFVRPVLVGHERLNFKNMCFLIENENQSKKILFDCGGRKDFWNGPPNTRKMISGYVPCLQVDKGVDEVLTEAGIDLKSIDAMVWSHWHWDHIGDATKFPTSTDVVVGPGFKKNFIPGYPAKPNGVILDCDVADRFVDEITFDNDLTIGGFQGFDYFGDGSFYILNVPGHAIGHVCGLARTTPTSFVFMGGDCCHFTGAFRPSSFHPLPDHIPQHQLDSHFPSPCPCSIFTAHHPLAPSSDRPAANDDEARSSPYYKVTREQVSAYQFAEEAETSINRLQVFDADPNVLICLAHDGALLDVLPVLNHDPKSDINDWKDKNFKEKTRWSFLNELPRNEKPGRPPLVTGQRRNGKIIAMGSDLVFREVQEQ